MGRRRSRRTDVLNLQKVLTELLNEYGDDVYEVLEKSVDDVVHDAVYSLRSVNHFSDKGHPSGAYAASWTNEEVATKKRLVTKQIVYNEEHYRLTHLLENGHVVKNGTGRVLGHAPAYPHIKKVEDEVKEELVKTVKKEIENL